eukprot:scaffold741_cov85-Amphora_coffeaeformis.AAC.2
MSENNGEGVGRKSQVVTILAHAQKQTATPPPPQQQQPKTIEKMYAFTMDNLTTAFGNMMIGRMPGVEYSNYCESDMEIDFDESDMDVDLEYADELMEGVEPSAEYDSLMDWELSQDDDLMDDVEYYDPADTMDL